MTDQPTETTSVCHCPCHRGIELAFAVCHGACNFCGKRNQPTETTGTDQMTDTEPARPDLEGMLISARACEDWTATVFTDFPIVCHYALRLESELAAMTADRDALIAAGIEETARADSEKQRADSAEQNNRILNAIVFPACGTGGITASLAPQLTVQAICAPIAANSPEQSVGGSESKE